MFFAKISLQKNLILVLINRFETGSFDENYSIGFHASEFWKYKSSNAFPQKLGSLLTQTIGENSDFKVFVSFWEQFNCSNIGFASRIGLLIVRIVRKFEIFSYSGKIELPFYQSYRLHGCYSIFIHQSTAFTKFHVLLSIRHIKICWKNCRRNFQSIFPHCYHWFSFSYGDFFGERKTRTFKSSNCIG